jgi:hypothetical protein
MGIWGKFYLNNLDYVGNVFLSFVASIYLIDPQRIDMHIGLSDITIFHFSD